MYLDLIMYYLPIYFLAYIIIVSANRDTFALQFIIDSGRLGIPARIALLVCLPLAILVVFSVLFLLRDKEE